MILCIGPTPAVQRVMLFHQLVLDTVNRAVNTIDGAAGKGVNVAKVLKVLGEEPVAMGFLGGDRGEFLRGALKNLGVEMDFVPVHTRTRECITVIDESTRTQTELVEESQPVADADYAELLNRIGEKAGRAGAVVCSGTITPQGPPDFYLRCAGWARDNAILSV